MGTTFTVREPVPSAFLPTVISTMRPAVLSKRSYSSSGGRRSFPFTARRYSPATTSTPGSVRGARSSGSQLRPLSTDLNW
jgi:hypothetical protein